MFEKVITQVLNKVLGNFIENIDPSQLRISVTSGKVKLQNMKIKTSLFDSMPVPFSLVQGQIGLINLKIPVLKLTSQPLIIEISDVFALIRPKHIKEWKADVEEQAFINSTQSRLDQYEVIESQTQSIKKSDPSSVDKLVQKIIDNIQVTIKNVYLRYEDDFSAPNYGDGNFVVGIMLRELSLSSTDANWTQKGVVSGGDITNKIAKISQLTIFMDYSTDTINAPASQSKDSRQSLFTSMTNFDQLSIHENRDLFLEILEKEFQKAQNLDSHQYILDRFSLEDRIAINKNPLENKLPQIDMSLLLGGMFSQIQETYQNENIAINFTVHQPQIIRILKLLEYIGYYNEFQRGSLVKFFSFPVSQDAANVYVEKYIEWKSLIASKKKDQANSKQKELRVLEDQSTFDKVIVLRKFANKLLDQQFNKKKEEQIIEKKVQEKKNEKSSVWGFFSSKAKKEQDKQEVDQFRDKLQKEFELQEDEKRRTLYNELSQLTQELGQTAIVTNEDFDKLPGDYIRFNIKVRAPSLKLSFLNEFEQNIFMAEIEDIVTDVRIGQQFEKVVVQLRELTLEDLWTGAKAYPNMIETKELGLEGQVVDEDETIQKKKQVLIVDFESNKQFKICPFKIVVETQKTLFVVVNMHLINEIERSIVAATKGETLDFSFFKEAATETAIKYIEQGKDLLEAVKSGQFNHQALDLTLFLTAPTIIVPENLFEPKRPCLVLDIGILELNSNLVPSEPFVDYKLIKSAASLYDRYEASLKSLEINILENGLKGVSNYKKGEGISLIKDFNAALFFFNCVEPMHPFFPTAELSVVIQNIELSFGLVALKTIMQIVNALDDQISTKEQALFNQLIADTEPILDRDIKSDIANKIGKDMIFQVRKKAEERKEEIGVGLNLAGEEEQEMFKNLKHAIRSDSGELTEDTEGSVVEKSDAQKVDDKEQLGTNFRIYFTVERLQIAFQDELVLNIRRDTHLNSLLCVLLDHFSVEVEIDRLQDIHVNVLIFKFIIEDTQMENPIATPFRMVLSSPIMDQQRQFNGNDQEETYNIPTRSETQDIKSSKSKRFNEISNNIHLQKKHSSSRGKSLLSYKDTEEYEIFEDALDTHEGQVVNEWELKLFRSKDLLDIKIILSDLTLIFALPTISKILEIEIKTEDIFKDLEQNRVKDFVKRLHLYEHVLNNIGLDSYDNQETFLKQIFNNQFKLKKIDQVVGLMKYNDGIKKLQAIWERQGEVYQDHLKITKQISSVSSDNQSTDDSHSSQDGIIKSQIKKNTRTEENKTRISVQARLNNFSIWLPLNAQDPSSKILSLSFISELHYEDQTFVRNNLLAKGEFDKYIANENYCTTKMLTPCRISLSYDSSSKDEDQLFRNNISIAIEPMHLKFGFKDIDFISIIYFMVDNDLLKQLRQRGEQSKSQSSSAAPSSTYQVGSEASYDDFLDNQFNKLRQNSNVMQKRKTAVKSQPQEKKKKKKNKHPKKLPTTWTTLKIECEALTISLDDDSEQIDHPLLYCTFQEASLQMKTYDKKDGPAIYYLKKMGIFQKRYPAEASDQIFRELKSYAKFTVNYYNQRSLAFEPLIEPWYLIASIHQEAPQTVQNIKVDSEHMLNINLTFGMALTVRRIMDRLEESLKQAKQIQNEQQLQELRLSDAEGASLYVQSQVRQSAHNYQKRNEHQMGFIFANNTGLDIVFNVHDEESIDNQNYQNYNKAIESSGINVQEEQKVPEKNNIFSVKGKKNDSAFKTFDELYALLQEINIRNNKGKVVESIEEDPLLLDIRIRGVNKVASIPIEGLGVYSYTATIEIEQEQSLHNINKSSAQSQAKKDQKQIGVICNIKMDGVHKNVSIESQLLISNNLSREIIIYCSESAPSKQSQSHEFQILIEAGQVFRVPITWLIVSQSMNLYIDTQAQPQLVLKHIQKCFTPRHSDSKLSQQNAQIIKLQEEYFTSMNIQGYYCQQSTPEDYPLQYVVSFDPPLMVNNFNFRPLEVRESKTQELLTLMAPKETAFINNIDTINTKPTLQWTFFESQTISFTTITSNFTISNRLDTTIIENFTGGGKSGSTEQRVQQLEMQVKKAYYQELKDYDENFELREKRAEYISSIQVMIYPKYMIVNKTNQSLILEGKSIPAMETEYFNTNQKKVKIKAKGYKASDGFDITTTGVQGKIELTLSKLQDVIVDKTKQNYIPQKLEFGLSIKRAPNPFSNTVIVTIAPRYVIINQIKKPIVIKQKNLIDQIMVTGQQQAYYFQEKTNQQIMFRVARDDELQNYNQGKKLNDELALNEQGFWSTPFSIEDIEDFQVKVPSPQQNQGDAQWFEPQLENNFNRFVRVVVTTQDDATILVVLSNPFIPEYEIINKTNYDVQFAQMMDEAQVNIKQKAKRAISNKDYVVGEFYTLQSNQQVAYAWDDRAQLVKKLVVKIGQKVEVLNLDKAMKKKEIAIGKDQNFNLEVRVAGNIKRVRITTVNYEIEKNQQALYLQYIIKRYQGQKLNLSIHIQGIGLSFIDEQPRELLYLSLYNIKFGMKNWIESRLDGSGFLESITQYKLYVDHLQLDNMINQIMPVVLAPVRPLLNKNSENKNVSGLLPLQQLEQSKLEESKQNNDFALVSLKDVEETPFIQLNVSQAETFGQSSESSKVTRIRGFQLAIQEFMIQVETTIVNKNFRFVEAIIKIFIDEKKFKKKFASADNFEQYKVIQKQEVCTDLDAMKSVVADDSSIQSNKMFIEFIHLGAIKVNITFQLEKKAFEFDITDPRKGFGATNILYSVLAGAASISDSSLRFKELILIDTFITTDMLVNQIQKNYTRQGILQFYKLIGSSDMIGNPLGLVDKLGTGVFEFFSEPKKGLLQGPEEFVGGVGKGVKSLVTNVVSGSFDSVSKITGSLYTVIKNVSGEENVRIKKADHVFDGVYQGVKGGVGELIGGVTGLVTKPIQKTKQEGAKGFFKGIGSGLMGAITAPITATLKLGSSVTDGVASTATAINNIGRGPEVDVKHVRFRAPRFINTKHIIQPFGEEISQVNQFLKSIRKGRYAKQQIRYFAVLPETTKKGALVSPGINDGSVLIITDKIILYLRVFKEGVKRGKAELIFKVRLRRMIKCEVFRAQNQQQQTQKVAENNFYLVLTTRNIAKGQRQYVFQTREYSKFEKIYNLISVVPECEGVDSVRNIEEKPTKVAIN